MKKLSAVVVLLVIFSIAIVAASAGEIVYTEASVNPGRINPDETTTVTLRAIANTATEKRKVDVVLVTDLSGSMNSANKLGVAKDALETFVALAGDEMYIGLASFSNASKPYSDATWEKWLDQQNNHTLPFHPYAGCDDKSKTSPNAYDSNAHNGYSDAHIDMSFTQDKIALNNTIDNYNAKGGTNIAGGINAAKKMLNESGNPDRLQVIVVMSDGIATMAPIEPDSLDAYMPSDWESSDRSETGRIAAKEAANVVKQDGVIVYAIGFGSGADETTLRDVASTGNYYDATVADIAEIYSEISGEIKKITGARAYHVLPADVDYVAESASAEPTVNSQTKTLEWNIGDLAPDAPWVVTFKVKPLNLGNHSVNVVPDSKVTYTSDSIPGSVSFPALFVAVTTLPVAEFDFSWASEEPQPHTNGIVTFDASDSYDPDGGSIVSYEWSGSFEVTGKIVTHVFRSEGNHTVTLTVIDDEGEAKEVSKVVKVVPSKTPVAKFNFSWSSEEYQPHKRETVTFDASASYDPDGGSIVSYDWDFDDGHTGSGETVTHAFGKGRNYTVTLTVTDDEGEIAEVSEVVGVDDNLPPVAVAKARRNVTDGWQNENITVPQYEPVMFDSSDSYDPDGYIVNYRWVFGDGKESPLAGPLHVYWENKTYNVSLIVEDNCGKMSEPVTLMVNVTPNNYIGSFANVSKNFTVEKDSDVNTTTTGNPLNIPSIGNPVNIFVHTTADNVSVINYSVFVDGCEIATGNEQEMKNFTWISMSSGKHKIKVRAYFEGDKSYEWVLDVVNVWIKQVGD